MFSVSLYQMAVAVEDLEQIVRKQRTEIQNIENVLSVLSALSGMDDALAELRHQKEEVELQQQIMLQMLQSLKKIQMTYEKAEDRIQLNAEGGQFSYVPVDITAFRNLFAGDQLSLAQFAQLR
jgi:tryptophanyl-tRNA synthetase